MSKFSSTGTPAGPAALTMEPCVSVCSYNNRSRTKGIAKSRDQLTATALLMTRTSGMVSATGLLLTFLCTCSLASSCDALRLQSADSHSAAAGSPLRHNDTPMTLRELSCQSGLGFMVSKSSGMIPILMAGLTKTATVLVKAVDIPSIEHGKMAQVLASVPSCDEMNIGVALQPLIISIFASLDKQIMRIA